VSTYDPTALDKKVPPTNIYLYGPFIYSAEQIRADIKANTRTFVAYTLRGPKVDVTVDATKICTGTDLDWRSDYWYRNALYIETKDLYLL